MLSQLAVSDLAKKVYLMKLPNISQNLYLFILIASFWNCKGDLKMTSLMVNGAARDFFIFAKVSSL